MAQIFLLSIRSVSIAYHFITPTIWAAYCYCYHMSFSLSTNFCSQLTTPFPSLPLPGYRVAGRALLPVSPLANEIGYRRGPSRAFFVTLFPNEVEYRRGIIRDYDPFPLPPSQTVQARFRAYSFPEETDNSFGNKQGLTHYAAWQPWQF